MLNRITTDKVGFGDKNANIAVYIGNRPEMIPYQKLAQVSSLVSGEIFAIGQACGNGWRKVFNVYAKLLYTLDAQYFPFSAMAPSWQALRDSHLLQQGSGTALIFSPPQEQKNRDTIDIICGRTYAKQLLAMGALKAQLQWLDREFAVDMKQKVIVCPYFDYRQLSNIKIERLALLLKGMVLKDMELKGTDSA